MTEALIKLKVDGAAAARTDVNSVSDALKGIGGIAATGLAALGVSLSAVSFAKMVMGSIESTAALKDLAIQTGSSTLALSEFRKLGAYTETSIDNIAGAMNKLAKNMSMSDESSKSTGQAIRALGLDFNALKSQSPDDQLITIAKSLDKFEDGAGKSAAAMALFGKEGAKLLPFLKDLADESENVTSKLSEQEKATKANLANMADNFSDNLQKMTKESQGWKKEIADAILPALDETAQAWIDVSTGPTGFKAEIKKLAADGTLADWARTAVTAVTYVMDVFSGLKAVAKSVGSYIGAYVASIVEGFSSVGDVISKLLKGDFDGATKAFSSAVEKQKAIDEGLREDLQKTWGSETLGSQIRSRIAEIQTVGTASKEVKKSLKFTNNEDNSANLAAINKEAAAYANWTAQVKERIEQYKLELAGEGKVGEARKLQIKLDQELKSGKLQLTAAHEKTLRENIEAAISEEKKVETMKSVAEAQRKLTEERDREYKSIADEAQKNEELVRTFGMTKAAIEEVELARMQERLAQKESLQLDDAEVKQLERLIDAKKRNAEAVSSLDSLNAAQKQLDDLAAEGRRFYEDLYRGLSDSLYRGFEAGKGFFQSFWDSLKNLFKTTVLKLAVQGVMTGVLGMGATGTANAASLAQNPLGSAISSIAAGKSLWEGFTGAAGAAGLSGSIGAGIAGLGNLFGSSSIAAFGTGMGLSSTAAASAASAYGAAGMASTGSALSAGASVSAAMPYVAAALAAFSISKSVNGGYRLGGLSADAGALLGFAPRLFGMQDKQMAGQTVTGTLGTDDLSRNVSWTQKGGLFRSDRSGVWSYGLKDSTAIQDGKSYQDTASLSSDKSLLEGLNSGYAAIKAASADYAKSLGLNADAIAARNDQLNITLGATQEETSAAIQKAFGTIADSIATNLLPSVKDLAKENETAASTLARVAVNFSTVNDAFGKLGLKLFEIGEAGIKASSQFTDAIGGLDAFKAATASFYENFYTQEERNATIMKSLSAEFEKQNLILPTSREAYRALVEEVSKIGSSDQLAALLKLNGVFASVVPATEQLSAAAEKANENLSKYTAATDAAASPVVRLSDAVDKVKESADNTAAILNQRQSLQDELDQLTLSSAQLLQKKRDALFEENRALFDSVQAAIAAKDASEKLSKANEVAAASYKQATDAIIQDAKDFASKQAATVTSLMNAVVDGSAATQKALLAMVESMTNARDALITGSQSSFSNEDRLSLLKGQMSKASDAELPALANTYLGLLRESGAAQLDYQREFASIVNRLDSAASEAQKQYQDNLVSEPIRLAAFAQGLAEDRKRAELRNSLDTEYALYAKELPMLPTSGFMNSMPWGNKFIDAYDALNSNSDDKTAKLIEEIRALRVSSEKTYAILDTVTAGGNAMLTESA